MIYFDMDRKKYIRDLFEVVDTHSILIINMDHKVPGLVRGEIASVTAIRMDIKLIDIYIVYGKPYYHYNFILYFE